MATLAYNYPYSQPSDQEVAASLDNRVPVSITDSRCNAAGDGVKLSASGSMSSSTTPTVLQLATGQVASSGAAVGKLVAVKGALTGGVWGGTGTITALNTANDTLTLSFSCTNTVTATDVYIGTDDTAALIAGKTVLANLGGGVLLIPPPKRDFYWIRTVTLDNTWSNIEIRLSPTTRLFSSSLNIPMFNYNTWPKQEWELTTVALASGYARAGTYDITIADKTDVNKPTVGQWCYIRTSNTYDAATVALAEYNKVKSVTNNAVTATITFERPLRHTYRPGVVSTPSYGVVPLPTIPVGFTLSGGVIEMWTALPFEVHAVDIEVRGTRFEGISAPAFRGRGIKAQYTAKILVDWIILTPPSHGRRPYGVVVDTGTTDFDIDATVESNEHAILHLHEGVAHGRVKFDFSLGENDLGVISIDSANNWGCVSLGLGIHDLDVKGVIRNCPAPSGFINNAGSGYAPGAENVTVDVKLSGITPNQLARSTVSDGGGSTNPANQSVGCAIPLTWTGRRITAPTLWSDPFLVYARGPVLTTPLSLSAGLALGGAVLTTQDGEPGIILPDASASPSVSWQSDFDVEYMRKRVARVMCELMNGPTAGSVTGAAGAPQCIRFDIQAAQGTTGLTISSPALVNPTLGSASKFPAVLGAKSFFYPPAGIFAVDTENAANRRRFMVQFTRFPTAGSDTLGGDVYIRRVWIDWYDPWASSIGLPVGPGPATLTDAATIAVDCALGRVQQVTLGGNRAMGLPTNIKPGVIYPFEITQDGTGGRTLTWNAAFKHTWSDTGNTAGKKSVINFLAESTSVLVQSGAQGPYV